MNRLGRIGVATALAMALGTFAAPALACSIMPPPPAPNPPAGTSEADAAALAQAWNQAHWTRDAEERRDWSLKQQARLFDEAKAIAVVRFEREDKTSGAPREFDYMNGQPLAVLKPVRWVKGAGASGELKLAMGQLPPCGQMAAHDAFYGKPGDVFLVYLSDGKLEQTSVLDGFSLEKIFEPRALAALMTRPQ